MDAIFHPSRRDFLAGCRGQFRRSSRRSHPLASETPGRDDQGSPQFNGAPHTTKSSRTTKCVSQPIGSREYEEGRKRASQSRCAQTLVGIGLETGLTPPPRARNSTITSPGLSDYPGRLGMFIMLPAARHRWQSERNRIWFCPLQSGGDYMYTTGAAKIPDTEQISR